MRTLFTLSASVALCISLAGCEQRTGPETSAATSTQPAAAISASVEFELPEAKIVQQIDDLPEGSTVLELLEKVENPKVSITGSGATAFVDSIQEIKPSGNEGWTFYINGEWATTGIGTQQVHDGDEITWKYGDFSPDN